MMIQRYVKTAINTKKLFQPNNKYCLPYNLIVLMLLLHVKVHGNN